MKAWSVQTQKHPYGVHVLLCPDYSKFVVIYTYIQNVYNNMNLLTELTLWVKKVK